VKISRRFRFKQSLIYFVPDFRKTGFSFGPLIFVSDDLRGRELIRHEYGHSIQSLRLGWFFWIIGIASVLRYRRFFRLEKLMNTPDEVSDLWREYHRGFPEDWTNRLVRADIDRWKHI
jgi:hypothetical protein